MRIEGKPELTDVKENKRCDEREAAKPVGHLTILKQISVHAHVQVATSFPGSGNEVGAGGWGL